MVLQFLVFGVFPGLVLLAATMDMFTMTIPNKLCLALVAAFFAAAPFIDLSLSIVGWHVCAALIALAITFLLFASGVFGGGDAKLTAAVVLWLGPSLALDFALLAALFGGILTAGLMVLRAFPSYTVSVESPWAARLLSTEVGIPYGIALSTAAMIVFVQSPWFAAAITH
ncbi:MAG: prepilin peptidase [Rhizobiales bacterium]|nr:prepilin peptidase [Hyphomicrobiales bacterium]MBO6699206.1 prepilin peptidase [Hyphomicrobiales bacterium]MBO6736744.1 prepilin peptidase [Hyphomicrobiales bacterium]MBO6912182.1 prepilin peptidase [Hyphomicrobiales bacterium]MBO6956677.1 prepilin peptidase [Hyphomicrobiales bacterium]